MKLSSSGRERIKVLICIFFLFSATFSIFTYTVEIREPWFGELSANHHQWLTGSTGIYATNWYDEGPLNLKFAMLDNPKSIEFQNISSRSPYTSYPPGTVFPIYLISEITDHKPTVSMIMDYNLLNQFFIAFILALTIFFFLRQLKIDMVNSFLFSLIPIILELLLPAPLYWFQNVFFSDQAIILPFVLYIFLEVIREGLYGKNLRIINIIQNLVLFYGFLTDWLFFFIALTVYTKRVIDGEIVLTRKFSYANIRSFLIDSLKFWLVPIIALALFTLQVFVIGETGNTVSRFMFRTGLSQNGFEYFYKGTNNLLGFIIKGYGRIGLYLLLVSLGVFIFGLLYLLFKKYKNEGNELVKLKKIVYLMALFIVPCVLQVYFLLNHSIWHDFSVLKFSLIISTVPLVLLPVMIFYLMDDLNMNMRSRFNIFGKFFQRFKVNPRLFLIFLVAFSAASCYVVYELPNYSHLFPEPNGDYELIGNSIQNNTGYNDVVFSPDFEIPLNPPQQLFYSMKRVYYINSTEDIKNKINGLNGGYDVVIVFLNPPSSYWKNVLGNSSYVDDGLFYYYHINPSNI
jgi:hypothetical protein